MSSSYDLAVLGGGVIGLSIAAESARRGWRVCLIERGQIGKESSWAGAGILPAGATGEVEDPIEQLRQLSDRLHEQWAKWLLDFTQVDNEYRRSGGLYLARSQAERATLRGNCLWWDELGIEYERLTKEQVGSLSEAVAPGDSGIGVVDYYWVARDAKLRNPRHLAALKAACEKLGVELYPNNEIVRVLHDGGMLQGVECHAGAPGESIGQGRTFHADRYCFATGAWTAPLLGGLGIETGIYPVRGQMLLYRWDRIPFPFVVNEGHRYLVPREDGRVLVGSCEEEVGFVKGTTPAVLEGLRDWAWSVCPGLEHATLELEWSGLRPGSIDAFPYLGTLYPYRNAYVAAGHFRHGLHWSTATAVLMGQHMRGEKTSIDLQPFRIQRGNA